MKLMMVAGVVAVAAVMIGCGANVVGPSALDVGKGEGVSKITVGKDEMWHTGKVHGDRVGKVDAGAGEVRVHKAPGASAGVGVGVGKVNRSK